MLLLIENQLFHKRADNCELSFRPASYCNQYKNYFACKPMVFISASAIRYQIGIILSGTFWTWKVDQKSDQEWEQNKPFGSDWGQVVKINFRISVRVIIVISIANQMVFIFWFWVIDGHCLLKMHISYKKACFWLLTKSMESMADRE